MKFYTSNQSKSPNVPYVSHMDPTSCQVKFEVMQPFYGLAARAPILIFLHYKPIKWSSCSEAKERLHDLKLYLATSWVHMGNIWNIWAFGLIRSMISQKWPLVEQF